MHFMERLSSADVRGWSRGRHRGLLPGADFGRVLGQRVKSDCPVFFPSRKISRIPG